MDIQEIIKNKRAGLKVEGDPPRLISLVAREDSAGQVYTNLKCKAAEEVGIRFKKVEFSLADLEGFERIFSDVLQNQKFDALIIQKPSETVAKKYFLSVKEFKIWWFTATSRIPEDKDVDGLNVANLGLLMGGIIKFIPAVVKGIYDVLRVVLDPDGFKGREVLIIGSSDILGKPLGMLLRNKGATVTICGDTVQDLKAHTLRSEVIISCVGKPKLITEDMVSSEAIVIDSGFSKVDGKTVGDVDFEKVSKKAKYVTPVPGGVGPLTVLCLMENVLKAKRLSSKKPGKSS